MCTSAWRKDATSWHATAANTTVIQLSGVDTFTALSSGASCFTENYLYTVEAIESAWNRLSPHGILSYSRYLLNPPRETLRLTSILREHLERTGVPDASRHVVVVRGKSWADTMLKKDPFTHQDVETIAAWCGLNQFAIVYDPFVNRNTVFDLVMRGSQVEREKFFADYTYEVAPTTDDRPFFFNYYKWRTLLGIDESNFNYQINCIPMSLVTMALGVLQVAVLGGLGILLPLLPFGQGAAIRGRVHALAYFCALGLGYMFVEIPLIQKFMLFLGGPHLLAGLRAGDHAAVLGNGQPAERTPPPSQPEVVHRPARLRGDHHGRHGRHPRVRPEAPPRPLHSRSLRHQRGTHGPVGPAAGHPHAPGHQDGPRSLPGMGSLGVGNQFLRHRALPPCWPSCSACSWDSPMSSWWRLSSTPSASWPSSPW